MADASGCSFDGDPSTASRTAKRPRTTTPSTRRSAATEPDWDLMATSEDGTRPFQAYLPSGEVDDLIGWATHGVSASVPANENNNPLLTAARSAPLRPSELHLIHTAMNEYIAQTTTEKKGRKKRKSRTKHNAPQKNHDNDNQEIIDWTSLRRQFDVSALVALGFCLEEMLTASLWPLACAHVERCRRLDDAWEDWNLPPERAVLALAADSTTTTTTTTTALPTALPATHTVATTGNDKDDYEMEESADQGDTALGRWLDSHGIQRDFFQRNRSLYAWLVGNGNVGAPLTAASTTTYTQPANDEQPDGAERNGDADDDET